MLGGLLGCWGVIGVLWGAHLSPPNQSGREEAVLSYETVTQMEGEGALWNPPPPLINTMFIND